MKKIILIVLLTLAACATKAAPTVFVETPTGTPEMDINQAMTAMVDVWQKTATAEAQPRVCYGDANKVYSVLGETPMPITLQGQVKGWLSFSEGHILLAQENSAPLPIGEQMVDGGTTYTITMNLSTKTGQLIGTVKITGFRCGNLFYFYIVDPGNPFLIG